MPDPTSDLPRPDATELDLPPAGDDVASLVLPYGLTLEDFASAAADIDSLIEALNEACASRGLDRIEDLLTTPATLSALISDVFAGALAKASSRMVVNGKHNGHPDLVPRGRYPDDSVQSGVEGVEVKATKNRISDAHGARGAWWCQVRYKVDKRPEVPPSERIPTYIDEILLARFTTDDFRKNDRKTETGTRTATPSGAALEKLQRGLVYKRATAPSARADRTLPASGSTP